MLERGVQLLIGLEAISDADERGMRTVMCILNGQLRPVTVRDRSIASRGPGRGEGRQATTRSRRGPVRRCGHRRCGRRATRWRPAQTIATIEAMKMEAAITAPKAGTVDRVAVTGTAQVEGGDLPGGRFGGRSEATGIDLTRIIAGCARQAPNIGARQRYPVRPQIGCGRSLFNVLTARLDFGGIAVLDLYAGSGALGPGGVVPRCVLGACWSSPTRARPPW